MLLVVVLPWVPDTPMTHLSFNKLSSNHCGPLVYGKFLFSTYSTAELPRDIAFPIMTISGVGSNWSVLKPSVSSIPRASSWVLMGGYTLVSEPVTLWPKAFAMAAMPPIKLPQIPRICKCIANSHFLLH